MVKIFWTLLLFACLFTFTTVVIAIARAMFTWEISSETEKKMLGICGISMMISGALWIAAVFIGATLLFGLIWR